MEQKVLILGARGMLGGELRRVFQSAYAWDREDADVTDIENLKLKIENLGPKPSALINCVAYNDVDGAEEKPEIAFKLNAEVPGNLAKLCKESGIPLMHFSTNYVFDGKQGEYRESDAAHPLSAYGNSKYAGEQAIRENYGNHYIVRTAVLFGPKGESELSKRSFVDIMLDLAQKSDTVNAVEDEVGSITYVRDLAECVQTLLLEKKPFGTYHVVNSGEASWYDQAREIFAILGKDVKVEPVPSTAFPRKAERPKRAVLVNSKLPPIRPWQEALKEFLIPNF